MMDSGYSLADIRAATEDRDGDGMFGGNGIWIILLFLLFGFGGGGMFGNRNNNGDCVTQADLCSGLNFNNLERAVSQIGQGISDSTFALNNTMTNGFNGVNMGLCNIGHQISDCCCQTNRNIDSLRYEAAKNTCDIIQAGHADTDRVIAQMTQNTIQELRDQLQAAQLTLANGVQTQNIVDAVTRRMCCTPCCG